MKWSQSGNLQKCRKLTHLWFWAFDKMWLSLKQETLTLQYVLKLHQFQHPLQIQIQWQIPQQGSKSKVTVWVQNPESSLSNLFLYNFIDNVMHKDTDENGKMWNRCTFMTFHLSNPNDPLLTQSCFLKKHKKILLKRYTSMLRSRKTPTIVLNT